MKKKAKLDRALRRIKILVGVGIVSCCLWQAFTGQILDLIPWTLSLILFCLWQYSKYRVPVQVERKRVVKYK